MAVSMEQKEAVVNFLKAKSGARSKFYFKDFEPLFPDLKFREIKKILSSLVEEQVLEYWSSGSTTMYGLKGAGSQDRVDA